MTSTFSDAAEPALIVYLMQTEADRKDISEPNIFKFQHIEVKGINAGNGQVDVDFDIYPPTARVTASTLPGRMPVYKVHRQFNFGSANVRSALLPTARGALASFHAPEF